MIRNFNTYVEACEFADLWADKYEIKIVKMNGYYMVICER